MHLKHPGCSYNYAATAPLTTYCYLDPQWPVVLVAYSGSTLPSIDAVKSASAHPRFLLYDAVAHSWTALRCFCLLHGVGHLAKPPHVGIAAINRYCRYFGGVHIFARARASVRYVIRNWTAYVNVVSDNWRLVSRPREKASWVWSPENWIRKLLKFSFIITRLKLGTLS